MKDYIERRHPEYRSSYDKLRRAVKEAWEAIGAGELFFGARDACKMRSLTHREDTQSVDRIV